MLFQSHHLALIMIITIFALLFSGYPVAFILGGGAIFFAFLGAIFGFIDISIITGLASQIYNSAFDNDILLAIPLFVLMGQVFEKGNIAKDLFFGIKAILDFIFKYIFKPLSKPIFKQNSSANTASAAQQLEENTSAANHFSSSTSSVTNLNSISLSILIVGAILAAASGIMGATVLALGISAYPLLLKYGYNPGAAAAKIAGISTLSQIIPPSTVLLLITALMQTAIVEASAKTGSFILPITVEDVFLAAFIPALFLIIAYAIWLVVANFFVHKNANSSVEFSSNNQQIQASINNISALSSHNNHEDDNNHEGAKPFLLGLLAPLIVITIVLGGLLGGFVTAFEAAALGACSAFIISFINQDIKTFADVKEITKSAIYLNGVIFTLIIAAVTLALVFRALNGELWVEQLFANMPENQHSVLIVTLLIVFLMGFLLDTFEVLLLTLPLFAPYLIALGYDPLHLAILFGLIIQTSFLTPPFGYGLFYVKSLDSDNISDYKLWFSVIPFIIIQLVVTTSYIIIFM